MPTWEIESPDGTLFEVEGDQEPTEEQINSFFGGPEPVQEPKFPVLPPQATLSDVLRQPTPIIPPWEGGVVRSVLPNVLQPEDLKPAVRLIGGDIAEGEIGDTHPDIIQRDKIPAIEIDQRGFTGPEGEFFDRESAAQATGLPTMREPGRLHSTDLSAFQEPGGFEAQLEAAKEVPEPLIKLPEVPESVKQAYSAPVRAIFGDKAADVEVAAADALYKTAKSVPEFLTTEEGLLSLVASLTPLGRAGVMAFFTLDQAKSVLDQAKQAGENWGQMTAPQKAAAVTQAAATLGFTALMAKAGIGEATRLVKPEIPTPPVIPKEAEVPRTLTPAVISDEGNIIETAPDHGTARIQLARQGQMASDINKEGFVDENGNFLTRAEAVKPFEEIYGKKPANPERLTSEDIKAAQAEAATPKPPPTPAPSPERAPSIGAGIQAALMRRGQAASVPIPQYGIAHRVSEARGVAAERGVGISPADSVQHGRELLSTGLDPNSVVDIFNKTKAVRADDIAVARAHGENLARAANAAADKFGLDSPEYEAAAKADKDWIAKVKPMQTEWHKIGQAQQGEVDVDTGSYHGLSRARFEDSGKDFTPAEAKTAQKISSGVKTASTATAKAKQALFSEVAKGPDIASAERRALDAASRTVRNAAARLQKAETKTRVAKNVREQETAKVQEDAARKALDAANKRARDASVKLAQYEQRRAADPARTLWDKAKEYIDQGMDNFDDIRHKLATDFGMPVDRVSKLMAQTKRVKYLADDLWRKQQTQRQLHTQAKLWLNSLDTPLLHKALASVPRILFGLKVGFHGTVALGTHAPMVVFQPRFWQTYVRDFGKMYKMVGSPAYYERQIQDLMRRDNYITARRAGLVNDPFVYEDYNSPDTAKYFGRLTGMGNRGYSVLKIIRQDMFDQMWNKLPNTSRIPEVAEALSDGINHATGVVKGRAPRGTNIALFAPRLEASRVMWLAGDPIRAADTFIHWNKATEADKMFALNQVKEKAWVAGTMLGMLAINQGVLSAVGSDQKINGIPESMGGAGFDPMRSDFLKFKAAGMNMGYGNAMLSMARLPLRLWVGVKNEGRFNKIVYEDENVAKTLFGYARSQASPFAGLILNLGLGRDFQERPLPKAGFGFLPGKTNIPKRLQAQGIRTPYTWTELWSEQLAPIPFQEAMVEVWHSGMGMNEEQVKQMKKAMATIAVMGATGARFTEDIPYKGKPMPRTLKEALEQR